MSNYADADDVLALVQVLLTEFTDITKPTLAQVDDAILSVEGEVDGVLKKAGYTVPVGNTSDVAMLRQKVAGAVAYEVWLMAGLLDAIPEEIAAYMKSYEAFLDRIIKDRQRLIGEEPEGDQEPSFGIANHVKRADPYIDHGGDWLNP